MPTFTPSMDMGGYVVVINAEQVLVTGNKFNQKLYRRHTTGRPGSMKVETFKDLQAVRGSSLLPLPGWGCDVIWSNSYLNLHAAPVAVPVLSASHMFHRACLCTQPAATPACRQLTVYETPLLAADTRAHHREGSEGHAHARPPRQRPVPPPQGAISCAILSPRASGMPAWPG